MNTKLLNLICALLIAAFAPAVFAQDDPAPRDIIKMVTQAPAGTTLRIYSMPYNDATVTGADESKFFGEYISKGPGSEITIAGNIEQLEVYNCQLSSMSVENAPELFILRCHSNILQSLDLRNCPKLSVVDCHSNLLSSLDVSANNLLEELNASDNKLENIVFGHQPALAKLNIASNKVSALNISGLPLLEELHAEKNSLEALDLSANTNVKWLHLYANRIAGPHMTSFMENLPEATQAPSLLYIVDTFNSAEANVCLMDDVEAASRKGWVTMDYAAGVDNAGITGQIYYGADYVPSISDNGIKFTTSRAPGQTVKLYIQAPGDFSIEGVAEKNFASGTATYTLAAPEVFVKGDISVFECPGNDITSIDFVGSAATLTSLDCSDNRIESLRINNAPALAQIHAQKNNIASLDITGCSGVVRLDCYDNNLRGNAMNAFMNSLPDGTRNNPYLFVIDTKSETEKNIATTVDVKIAKDKNWVVFDFIGGDRFGMGTRYDGSEPVEPEVPEQFFTFSAQVSEVLINLVFSQPDFYPVVEDAEILGWGSGALTLRVTPGKTVKVFGDATFISSNIAYIDTFDASECPNLKELNLMANELKSLDVSKNTRLQTLLVFGNSLESLDVSGCPDLKLISCYGNRLAGDAMTRLMSSLPVRSLSEQGRIVIYDGNYEREHNVCSEYDVAAAFDRFWITYELNAEGQLVQYYGISGVENVEANDCDAPVEYFNLQGVCVKQPSSGLYIRRQGSKVEKVRIP